MILPKSTLGKTHWERMTGRLTARFWVEDTRPLTAPAATFRQYRRRNVGFVFQFCNLVPSLTARARRGLSARR